MTRKLECFIATLSSLTKYNYKKETIFRNNKIINYFVIGF